MQWQWVVVGAAFVAGCASSALWYEPGVMSMKAAQAATFGSGGVAAFIVGALIWHLQRR